MFFPFVRFKDAVQVCTWQLGIGSVDEISNYNFFIYLNTSWISHFLNSIKSIRNVFNHVSFLITSIYVTQNWTIVSFSYSYFAQISLHLLKEYLEISSKNSDHQRLNRRNTKWNSLFSVSLDVINIFWEIHLADYLFHLIMPIELANFIIFHNSLVKIQPERERSLR